MILEDQGLGLGLGSGVGIERIGGGGHGLVGPVMVAPFVDAERADVDEPLEPGGNRGIEQQAEGIDVEPAELVERAPVADLGGAVEHPVGAGDAGSRAPAGSSRSPTIVSTPHWSSQRVSLVGRTSARTRWPRSQGLFGRVAADQPGRAGDEDGFR